MYMTKDEIYSKANDWFIGLPKGEKFELSREEILMLLTNFQLHLLKQCSVSGSLPLICQFLYKEGLLNCPNKNVCELCRQ